MATNAIESQTVQAALQYAAQGWPIVMLYGQHNGVCTCHLRDACPNPGKHPRGKEWQFNATSSDEDKLLELFERWPDSNIGILLGPTGGVIDVEFDSAEGRATADRIFANCFTPTYKSARSVHRLFKWNGDLPDVQKVEIHGLEIRLGGGGKATQSVLPPSRHASGVYYAWMQGMSPSEVDLADVPESVSALFANCRVADDRVFHTTASKARELLAADSVNEGSRNDSLYKFACSQARRTNDANELFEIVQGINVSKCKPPLDREEVHALCTSAIEFVRKQLHQSIVVTAETLDLRSAEARTDTANARRLRDKYGDKFRWCETWGKWLVWDGNRWAVDQSRQIDAFAKDIGNDAWGETGTVISGGAVDLKTSNELLKFAKSTASARGIEAMVKLVKSEPGIPISPLVLDTHPFLLNCPNGTLNLRTGELRPHDRADMITRLCPTEYHPHAECPVWTSMVDVILNRNADLIRFMQRTLGYALTGDVSEQSLFVLCGSGANGKSTLLNAVQETMGRDYAMTAVEGLLMAKKGEAHSTERFDLFGKRLAVCMEVNEGRRFDEALVKQLTGGDMIRARRMREDNTEFEPTHKIFMGVNHKPEVRGTDHGIWRRLKLIPFDVRIEADQQDRKLSEKLTAEREGILAWMVRGCLDWQRSGLGEPPAVTAATQQYREEQDILGAFLKERCTLGPQFKETASSLYAHYVYWCRECGEFQVTRTKFGQALTERGFKRYTNNGTWYRGVAISKTEGTEGTEGLS